MFNLTDTAILLADISVFLLVDSGVFLLADIDVVMLNSILCFFFIIIFCTSERPAL